MKVRRLLKDFGKGEKGFTLLELLIVVVILGILAAVIVPNLATFLSTGQVAAANTEVANVETAALAYYADNDGDWPTDTNTATDASLMDPPGDAAAYLDGDAIYDYAFDGFGKVSVTDGTDWPNDANVEWVAADHEWAKK